MAHNPSEAQTLEASSSHTESADLRSAERVLRLGAEGVNAIAAALSSGALGGAFTAAIGIIAGLEGRVVVTGMGKSGHVARKVAATMASVGTPALFVHPGEASHGDLGMITSGDAVLALSNSGETSELSDIVTYTRRFSIPLIGITSRADGALAEAADAALVLPTTPEACPLGLAPTTSTTMMLALGDAMAVALLERRGFSAEDFQVLHPGGKLGKSLLRVSELMHTGDEMPLTAPDQAMSDVLITITAKRFGCVGVVDGANRLIGVITDGDLRRHMAPELLTRTASEVMTTSPKTIRPEALAAEALGVMTGRMPLTTSLFVVQDGVPLGILHMHDCLRAGVA